MTNQTISVNKNTESNTWTQVGTVINWIGLVLTGAMLVIELLEMLGVNVLGNLFVDAVTRGGSIQMFVYVFGSMTNGILSLGTTLILFAGFFLMIRKNDSGPIALLVGIFYYLFCAMLGYVVQAGMVGATGTGIYIDGLIQGLVICILPIVSCICYYCGPKTAN